MFLQQEDFTFDANEAYALDIVLTTGEFGAASAA